MATYGLYNPWNSPGQNTGMGIAIPFSRYLLNPEINPRSPALQILYQLSQPGRPKNAGVGSLSLLQWIFPTQELN